jgi:hypothetical protein
MQNTISTYNGWTNRETWLVSLWLNNDEASYQLLLEAISLNKTNFKKSEWLKSKLEDEMYDLPLEAGLWTDLLSTALAKVNWLEVIENNQS